MTGLIYKTKISLIGIITTGIILILITYFIVNYIKQDTIKLVPVLLAILFILVFSLPQLSASTIMELYKDKLVIKFPFLSFLPQYKDKVFNYKDIEYIRYHIKIRQPNLLEIKLKNKNSNKYWCRFRFNSHDKINLMEQFNNLGIEYSIQRFKKIYSLENQLIKKNK